MKKILALSLDGGFLRGLLQVQIIDISGKLIGKKISSHKYINDLAEQAFSKTIAAKFHMNEAIVAKTIKCHSSLKELSEKLSINKDKLEKISLEIQKNVHSLNEKKTLMDYVKFVGGVSIGSVIGTYLSVCENGKYKYTSEHLLNNFNPAEFLKKNFFLNLGSTTFDDKYFSNALEKMFTIKDEKGSHVATFADFQKAKLLIPSFNLDDCQQTIFTNFCDEIKNPGLQRYVAHIDKISLVDAIMSSASAQTAFPAREVKYHLAGKDCRKICDESKNNCSKKDLNYAEIDGSNVRNTPILEIITTLNLQNSIPLKDMFILSLGTGNADFDLRSLDEGTIWDYLHNIVSDSHNSFIGGIITVNESSTKAMAADLINAAGGSFYDIDIMLDKELYNGSQDFSNYPKYLKAVNDYFAIPENFESLSRMTDEIIFNDLLLDRTVFESI